MLVKSSTQDINIKSVHVSKSNFPHMKHRRRHGAFVRFEFYFTLDTIRTRRHSHASLHLRVFRTRFRPHVQRQQPPRTARKPLRSERIGSQSVTSVQSWSETLGRRSFRANKPRTTQGGSLREVSNTAFHFQQEYSVSNQARKQTF